MGKGCAYKLGVDFDETFSSIVCLTNIRVVLMIVAIMDIEFK